MDERPSIFNGISYCDPNRRILILWLWKIYRVSLLKDHHTLVNVDGSWAGFFIKSGTLYYATLARPKG